MEKYNFITRLSLIPITLCIALPIWLVIGIFSTNSLGKVLKQTGENLLKD